MNLFSGQNLKALVILSMTGFIFPAFSQVQEEDGVLLLNDSFGRKISHDGIQIVGETLDGATFYYNYTNDQAFYYGGIDFGKGYVIADNGWVVGSELDDFGSHPVIMKGATLYYPDFIEKNYGGGNIHSITPDASRVCGVVANMGAGPTYFPFVADMSDKGTIDEITILPGPKEDLLKGQPQFCSATWISEDGKTIAGQVVDGRGIVVYPILYKQDEAGVWSYSLPSEQMFNPKHVDIPDPMPEMEEMYPDLVAPDPESYMTPEMAAEFEEAINVWAANGYDPILDPYEDLDSYMTEEKYQEFLRDEEYYYATIIEYNELFNEYMNTLWEVIDESVVFLRNAMALSADGKWLASSAAHTVITEMDNEVTYLTPYLFNLENGEVKKIGEEYDNLHTNQVLPGGRVVCNSLAGMLPQRSYIYDPKKGEMIKIEKYLEDLNPSMADWMKEYLTSEFYTDNNPSGSNSSEKIVVSGIAAISEDFSVISGGVDGFALGLDTYITYIMRDVNASVESLKPADGVFRVYNMQGVNLMNTKNIEDLKTLGKGIYIVNGKKIINT